ncbi:MAG: TonB-dependent receptor domain-containing protein [Sphingobacterium sp.]|uniref:TonB-dependent receptor domain-containing protein n=1 Tax=Sphingobacterium sp. JB170 TaxID=1434842 RepID=UPI00097F1D0A|nr:TonB-dependent receptor [Sphingobacterium sp. JB170]SJN32583.1 Probable Co/Zn/Cd efflux system membrane fusion protein [Sphingobacterium sp. JB170]
MKHLLRLTLSVLSLFLILSTYAQTETNISFKVAGNCGLCKQRIEKAAKIKGVASAEWTAATQMANIQFDSSKTTATAIKQAIAEAGHDTDEIRAENDVYEKLHECCLYERLPRNDHTGMALGVSSTGIQTISFPTSGVCKMCKKRIEESARIDGVKEVEWELTNGITTVTFDGSTTNASQIKQAIAQQGHDTDDFKAPDDTYLALPDCCKYQREGAAANEHPTEHSDHEHMLRGVVVKENDKAELTPIPGVNISWLENPNITIQSNQSGVFELKHEPGFETIVVSFVGMQADTITVKNLHDILVIHAKDNVLEEVVVSSAQRTNYISKLNTNRVETITAKELFKAACCDLSESFETNGSVDVVNSDAVTGSKQIQLLGLSGVYTQLTVENMPGPRGFAGPLGLNSMAGPWIESIQISKGMGSVANGFESMSGQINVELKKPNNTDQLHFNLYANNMGRGDVNLNLAHKINDKWSVGMLLHDNFMFKKDVNFSDNGYRDIPAGNVFSGVNRWTYENGQGLIAQFGVKYLRDDRTGGEIDFNENTDKLTTNRYGLGFDIKRVEGFAKIGYIFPNHRLRSIGLQLSGSHYEQDSYFGLTTYDNEQQSGYANFLYQDVIGSVKHKYRAGLSVSYDKYNESILNNRFKRTETVSGAFAEYTYAPTENFDAILGLRQDYNSIYGWFTTPRAVVRYAPTTGMTLRLSSGRGQRTANIFAENMGIFASSRSINLTELSTTDGTAYGLDPEVSWNTGITADQEFQLLGRQAGISVELFHNRFSNQVLVDLEDPSAVSFYNLTGKSYSNSLQTDFRFMPVAHLEARFAYRLLDVKTDYQKGRLQKALTAKHRGFMNLAYNLHTGWSFDYTLNAVGKKRLPSTQGNPERYQLSDYSDSYLTMNAQVSKSLGASKNFTVYVGGENLTNFYQKDPILAFDDPFGDYFDTNLLWGPISGRLFYAGIRYTIK